MNPSLATSHQDGYCCARGDRWLATAAVFASFLLFSAVRFPVPGINEPHYLPKAKNYWNPDWCRGDFFLESADAHVIFYQTVGVLTQWLTLEQTAWAGRVAALLLLAVGWTALVSRLLPGRWSSVWAAWTFLALAAVGNFSGEWIVGSVEAKVFSYGFLFWALAFVFDRSWNRAAVCAGFAIGFHPVVGLWGLTAGTFAGLTGVLLGRRRPPLANVAQPIVSSLPFHRLLVAGVLLVLCALPGLIPALWLLGGVDAVTRYQANYIQVYGRLGHHLDPKLFPATAYLFYLFLLAFWLLVRRRSGATNHEKLFARFVAGSVLIAAAGLVVGWGPKPVEPMQSALRIHLMTFYPFRLFDVMVPVAASVTLAGWIESRLRNGFRRGLDGRSRLALQERVSPHGARRLLWGKLIPAGLLTTATASGGAGRKAGAWILFAGGLMMALVLPPREDTPPLMNRREFSDWRDLCRWVAAETPADSLFLTPKERWAFKWYAERPEFVAFKDCPQDAPGIVEWQRRLRYVRDWSRRHYDNGFSAASLHGLHAETGITHIIARQSLSFESEPIYGNPTFAIYRLRETRADDPSSRRQVVGPGNESSLKGSQ